MILESKVNATEKDIKSTKAFENSLQSLGANRYAYFYRENHNPKPIITSNLPHEWFSEYENKLLHRIDPVLEISKNTAIPFSWSTEDLNKQNQNLLKNALKHNITEGYTFITISHDQTIGTLTLCIDQEEKGLLSKLKKNEAAIQLCLLKYHEKRKHIPRNHLIDKDENIAEKLSSREMEVLRWIATGKTYSETAMILGITERTIKFHATNIKQKLNVYSARQMTYIATKNGLIDD